MPQTVVGQCPGAVEVEGGDVIEAGQPFEHGVGHLPFGVQSRQALLCQHARSTSSQSREVTSAGSMLASAAEESRIDFATIVVFPGGTDVANAVSACQLSKPCEARDQVTAPRQA